MATSAVFRGQVNSLMPRQQVAAMPDQNVTGGLMPPRIDPIMPPVTMTPGVMSPTLQPANDAPRGTGLLPMTPEEMQRFRDASTPLSEIIPNLPQIPIKDTGPNIVPQIGQEGGQPITPALPPPPAQFNPMNQQFGLSGAEQAFMTGAQLGTGAIGQGTQAGLQTLLGGFQQGQQSLGRGRDVLSGVPGASVVNVDPTTGQPLFREGASGINQFTGAGVAAQRQQAALSGALGPEAQRAAMDAFMESPGQQFLREQGEQSRINQAAALGGLGGGEILKELTRFGTGLAAQDFQNQFNRLGQLSGQGLQAATSAGQLLGQAGAQQGQLASQNAQLGTNVNLQNAANQARLAQAQADLFGREAGLAGQLASQGAGMQGAAGNAIANLLSGTGANIGQARLQAGRDIAGQIGTTTAGLSNLANQQGAGLSDLIGTGAGGLASLLTGAGQAAGLGQQDLARLLAGITTGQGNLAGNIALQGGQTGANLALAQGAANQSMLNNLMQIAGFGIGQIPTTPTPTPIKK